MNGLLAAMAVANPVLTALLTIIIFLEKDKIKQRSENLEATLNSGNQELVQTVAGQKENFENIASRLEALSKDSAKSAETFVGLSTALTESSAVSASALNGITMGLENHAKSVEGLVTKLSDQVSTTASNSIGELAIRSEETLRAVVSNVQAIEVSQDKAISSIGSKAEEALQAVAKSIEELTKRSDEQLQVVSSNVQAIEVSQDKAISSIGSKAELTLQAVLGHIKSLENAQNNAIETLGINSKNTLGTVADEVKKVEVAQIAVANAVKDLQETLKITVSL